MSKLLLLAIFLVILWVVLRVALAITGVVLHLLWIIAIILAVLWLLGAFGRKLTPRFPRTVHYRGESPMWVDVVGGQVQMAVGSVQGILPHIQRGAVRVESGESSRSFAHVAFRNPNGGIVLVVVNSGNREKAFTLSY